MRVAFINPQGNFDPTDRGWAAHPDFGGQLVYVKEVALALGRMGHRADIITRRIDDPEWPEFAAAQDGYPGHANVRILRFPCGSPGFLRKEELWPHLSEWAEHIAAFYSEEGAAPDAATGHYGDGGLAAALLEERLGTPFTFTGHSLGAQKLDKLFTTDSALPALLAEFHFEKRLAAERLSMARAARIITSTRQERFEQYGHAAYRGAVDPGDDRKFAVIPPGVNLGVFDREARNELESSIADRVEAMLDRDIAAPRRRLPVVISSSRLEPKKNHEALVRAWADDAELREAANLMIIVRGARDPLRKPEGVDATTGKVLAGLRAIIDEADLSTCVTAFDLNSQLELAAAYRHLAARYHGVFCLPSVYEPFGLAPLEAMAAGLPAVVTRNGGPSESLVEDGMEYGVLVDPRLPVDIARGLKRLVIDAGQWRRLQRLGRERVADRYTWARTAAAYLQTIESILSGGSAADPSYPKPSYFEDPAVDDLDLDWLRSLYPLPGDD